HSYLTRGHAPRARRWPSPTGEGPRRARPASRRRCGDPVESALPSPAHASEHLLQVLHPGLEHPLDGLRRLVEAGALRLEAALPLDHGLVALLMDADGGVV